MEDGKQKPDRKSEIGAVAHAIGLLRQLGASKTPLGVNELARRVSLHKSSVSRLMSTLENYGFVEREDPDGRYGLGVELVALAGPMIADLDVVKVSRPVLRQMADETGETVYVAVWSGRDTIMIEQAKGERAVAHYAAPGTSMPTHASAAGKLFMAFRPDTYRSVMAEPELEVFTEFTHVGDALQAELEEIRQNGFAVNDQEYELESCGVAAPIRDVNGVVVGALTVAAPKHRFSARQQMNMAVLIVRQAAELSRRMGFSTHAA
ncbi:MAG: IclR family transcriptional regulator [Pseudomonadota bacterium]|nr:IclR family transcriptional regulator [Pseudomonadota bacterium]